MKRLFNKYFKYIGVENEGFKRIVFLLIVTMFISEFFTDFFIVDGFFPLFVEIKEFIGFEHSTHLETDEIDFIIGLLILLSFPFIFFGLLIGTFNWIKEGFRE